MELLKQRYLIALAAPVVLAGCGGGTAKLLNPAPYADTYEATYATPQKDDMSKVLQKVGEKIHGAAAPVRYLNTAAKGSRIEDAQPVTLEKSEDGYTLHAGGETVTFTSAEKDPDGFYQLQKKDSSGDSRTLAYFYPAFGDLSDIDSPDNVMLPLGYGMRVKDGDGAATVDDSDGFQEGYTIVGLETKPSEMPKTGSATYSGSARIEAHDKATDFDKAMIHKLRYRGDAKLIADFGAGTVSGSILLKEQRATHTQTGNAPTVDISASGAAIAMQSTKIIGNGFDSELVANSAARAQMAADGISADTEARAVGRFYGTDARSVGAVIAGGGSSHVVTGVIGADKTP